MATKAGVGIAVVTPSFTCSDTSFCDVVLDGPASHTLIKRLWKTGVILELSRHGFYWHYKANSFIGQVHEQDIAYSVNCCLIECADYVDRSKQVGG